MSESDYRVGTKISRYEITSVLGRGAMGVVYRATDTSLDRDVALKIIAPAVAAERGGEALTRFHREAKALARVQHPNVVTVHDVGSHTDGSPYIVMEFLTGQDLQGKMRAAEMPVKHKIAIVLKVLEGLSHAHAASIVHRDIKPANIFVCADERVKITDFGIARLAEQTMTLSGIGSPAYMSPEQANKNDVDLRSDLFSVASVTYELFLGRRPFATDTIPGVLYKALEKDPGRRYQSAREFAEKLRRATALFLQPPHGSAQSTCAPRNGAVSEW